MHTKATIKFLIFSLILLTVSVAVAGYTLYTLNKKGATLLANMQSLRDHDQLQAQYGKLEEQFSATEGERERLQALVLESDSGAVTFLSEIDELAKGLGLTVETKQLDVTEVAGAAYDDLTVGFLIKGDSRTVVKLLQLFELLPYHSQVIRYTGARKVDPETNREITEATITLRLSITKQP